MAKKNERRPANSSMVSPRASAVAHVLEPVGDGERELLDRGRSGLLHVVAGDRDRVELRHAARGVLDDVGHDPHAGLGRIDVGVADHELFEDVVLDGPGEERLVDALLLRGHHVAGEDRQHRAVHRHRHGHLVERDPVEEDLHVLDRVDGDAGLAHVADHARVVAVVAAVGGEVEGHREPHLPGGEVGAVELVRLLGGGEPRVLADGPRPVGVHRRPDAADERVESGERPHALEALEVLGGVERLDRDALGRDPGELVQVALGLLRRQCFPVGPRRTFGVTHAERVRPPLPGREVGRLGVSSPVTAARRLRPPRAPGGPPRPRHGRRSGCAHRGASRPSAPDGRARCGGPR